MVHSLIFLAGLDGFWDIIVYILLSLTVCNYIVITFLKKCMFSTLKSAKMDCIDWYIFFLFLKVDICAKLTRFFFLQRTYVHKLGS